MRNTQYPPFFCKGFTLIEILVVVFIIAVASTAALLVYTPPKHQEETIKGLLFAQFEQARKKAIWEDVVVGVHLEENSISFSTYTQQNANRITYARPEDWAIYSDKWQDQDYRIEAPEKLIPWQKEQIGVFQSDDEDDEANTILPQIVIKPSGQIIPSSQIYLKHQDFRQSLVVDWTKKGIFEVYLENP